ncbi:MAG: oxygen-independent coproporphyrinogen III oxidase [Lachnospiraceae bacterium]|nr:oxygen-independent coproporphyrinogen III oxidase [Lachnospiraceae bacterium]
MELYVHIPFCVRKCLYCDFLSFATDREHRESYIDALVKELGSFSGLLSDACGFRTAFIGGGTPSVLENDLSEKLLSSIRSLIADNAEFSLECNPGTVDREKLKLYKEYGINRLSIGLQSADDAELKILGRIHDYKTFLDTYELARSAGFENINIDIMSGLPGQTVQGWENTLKKVAGLSPEHISAYSLIIEPGTPFYDIYGQERKVRTPAVLLPDEDDERRMYHLTSEILSGFGFHRYEISNYAKEGFECRHNLGYWKNEEYLGAGIGASSYVGIADNKSRYKNTDNFEEYIDKAQNGSFEELHIEKEKIDAAGAEEEFIILRMRLSEGIDKKEYKERFNKDFDHIFSRLIGRYTAAGLIKDTPDRISFTEEGFDVSNTILADMITCCV